MKNPADQIPGRCRWIIGTPESLAAGPAEGPPDLLAWTSRGFGETVTDHRSSWVRRCQNGSRAFFVKTYDYPTARDRRRGWFRTTLLAPSRAAREARALLWLREHGFAAPEPVLVAEWRRLGVLRRAVLVTTAWPGEPLTGLAVRLDEADRLRLGRSVAALVAALHRAGFRDRNLDARNLLARAVDGGFEIAVIDSPRFRLRRPGRTADRLARTDWQRLRPQLDALGIPLPETQPV